MNDDQGATTLSTFGETNIVRQVQNMYLQSVTSHGVSFVCKHDGAEPKVLGHLEIPRLTWDAMGNPLNVSITIQPSNLCG